MQSGIYFWPGLYLNCIYKIRLGKEVEYDKGNFAFAKYKLTN